MFYTGKEFRRANKQGTFGKAIRKTSGLGWIVHYIGDVELPPAKKLQIAGPNEYRDHLGFTVFRAGSGVAFTGVAGNLVIPKENLRSWGLLDVSDIPSQDQSAIGGLAKWAAREAFDLISPVAIPQARPGKHAICITYDRNGTECALFVTYQSSRDYQKVLEALRQAVPAAETVPPTG